MSMYCILDLYHEENKRVTGKGNRNVKSRRQQEREDLACNPLNKTVAFCFQDMSKTINNSTFRSSLIHMTITQK